eukprot:UN28382
MKDKDGLESMFECSNPPGPQKPSTEIQNDSKDSLSEFEFAGSLPQSLPELNTKEISRVEDSFLDNDDGEDIIDLDDSSEELPESEELLPPATLSSKSGSKKKSSEDSLGVSDFVPDSLEP